MFLHTKPFTFLSFFLKIYLYLLSRNDITTIFNTTFNKERQFHFQVNAFNAYDRDRAGFLDETELDYALKMMDINFSPDFIKFLITRSDPNAKKMSLDQFIVTCIQIQRYTDEFKSRDEQYSGVISIKYEDFLELVMRCLWRWWNCVSWEYEGCICYGFGS